MSMFKKSNKKPITLHIGDRQMSFASSEELEFALAGRIGIPSSRIKSLVAAPSKALQKEAEGIKQIEQKLTKAIALAMEDDNAIGEFFKELDVSVISQDNDWRTIMNALYGLDSSSNEYRKVGLVKYLQYLTARHEVVQTLYLSREKQQPATPPAPPPATQVFKETVLFDLTSLRLGGQERRSLWALAKR